MIRPRSTTIAALAMIATPAGLTASSAASRAAAATRSFLTVSAPYESRA